MSKRRRRRGQDGEGEEGGAYGTLHLRQNLFPPFVAFAITTLKPPGPATDPLDPPPLPPNRPSLASSPSRSVPASSLIPMASSSSATKGNVVPIIVC
jgi:hypothetical protein